MRRPIVCYVPLRDTLFEGVGPVGIVQHTIGGRPGLSFTIMVRAAWDASSRLWLPTGPRAPAPGTPRPDRRAFRGHELVARTSDDAFDTCSELPCGGHVGFTLGIEIHSLDGSLLMPPAEVCAATRTDDGMLEIALRAATPFRGVIDRIAVALLPRGGLGPGLGPARPELRRAEHGVASLVADAARGLSPPPPTTAEALVEAYSTWDAPGQELWAVPTLSPKEAQEIAHALARTADRPGILARFGLTPYEWDVEEVAQAGALADGAVAAVDEDDDPASRDDGAATLAGRFALEAPEPSARSALDIETYARISADLRHRDSSLVLREAGLSVGGWLDCESAMDASLRGDPDAEAQLDELIRQHEPDAQHRAEQERASLETR